MLEVDVVHSGEDWEEAARKIEAAVDQAVHRGHKGVKIIHGHGSATGRSALAPRAMTYMRHLAEVTGGRFTRDRNNPGASIIWLNR
jgi:DNA-nicking Smr family endonuclease